MLKGELFSTDMVRAYLDGRKLHTARPVQHYKRTPSNCGRENLYTMVEALNGKPFYGAGFYKDSDVFQMDGETHVDAVYFKAKYRPGDFMYCRETWAVSGVYGEGWAFGFDCSYKAGGIVRHCITRDFKRYCECGKFFDRDGWAPSIHMPREAARLFFRISRVEAMRLDDVTEEFAREDGFTPHDGNSALDWFRVFWQGTYGDAQWMWVYWTDPVAKEEALANAQ